MIDYIGETKINERVNSPKVKRADDVFKEIKEFKNKSQEHFIVLYLDGDNKIIETRVISVGTLNQTLVHPREVFAPAIEQRSASIIVAHNHPSGTLSPSSEDMEVTNRLKEASKILGIELLDHIIFSVNGYLSLRDEGLI